MSCSYAKNLFGAYDLVSGMKMENNLIFDVGMHKGEDTSYYLYRGFKVVAIDANPSLIEIARNHFSSYGKTNQLILLNFAVSDKDNEEWDFNISKATEWSSFKKQISNREGLFQETVKVKTKRLSSLMMKFGVPCYCKIDVEGYDKACLDTLSDIDEVPKFISVETECLGEFEVITDEQALATLNRLYGLGYSKFKLIDQATLNVLRPGSLFYTDSFVKKILRERKYYVARSNRERLSKKHKYTFTFGSSGPFGDELEGRWLDYDTAKKTLLFHRNARMNSKKATRFGFWCDWHARLE
jgi:FkbM family methyltransferase